MKKIHFIDCGANIGQSIEWALKEYGDRLARIDSFEPEPELFKTLQEKYGDRENIRLHNSAVWTSEEEKEFYVEPDDTCKTGNTFFGEKFLKYATYINVSADGQHSSIIKEERIIDPRIEKIKIKVPCIDLARWLTQNVSVSTHNILKLDIEGSEYNVIPHLLKKHLESLISEWFIEWHDFDFVEPETPILIKKFIVKNILDYSDWAEIGPEGI